MAQQRFPLLTSTTGLNNKTDPARIRYDRDAGVVDLAEAVNIDIDDTGGVISRQGQVQVSAEVSHSLFCDGGEAFVVQDRTSDAALYQIATDLSLTGLRSGMTKGARVSFCTVGLQTFYVNGVQNGVISGGVSNPWPVDTYVGPDTVKGYSPAPVGTHLTFHKGRMFIAVGATVYASELYKMGLYRMARCFWQFGSDVSMIKAVENGLWVSDARTTGFIYSADTWDGYRYQKKADTPAHEWSVMHRLLDLSKTHLQISGRSAIWSSNAGLMVGSEDGNLLNVTELKIIYPKGSKGATVADGLSVINNVE